MMHKGAFVVADVARTGPKDKKEVDSKKTKASTSYSAVRWQCDIPLNTFGFKSSVSCFCFCRAVFLGLRFEENENKKFEEKLETDPLRRV